jgi:hypothetical protein
LSNIGLALTLTLVSAYLMGQEPPPLPPTQGPHGLTDEELYVAIVDNGNPLGTMTFSQAVNTDPRRVEALVLQRVIEPFYVAICALEHPGLQAQKIQGAMRHAYLQRNHELRQKSGKITATELAEATQRSWKMNSEIFRVAFEMQTPAAQVLQKLMSTNRQDIRRAFREANRIAQEAGRASQDRTSAESWAQISATLKNMSDNVETHLVEQGEEVIDDEIMWIQPVEHMGSTISRADLFGAVSLKPNLLENFGEVAEHEEYIVTGHRAPAVGLSQYRRMGGRVY